MTVETVQISVFDQQLPLPQPIENVLVRIFDVTGTTFITQNYTDSDGIADFTLDGDNPPIEYQIRLSKTGVAFDGGLGEDSRSPQIIEIYSPDSLAPNGSNDFVVRGQTFTRPVALDPNLCRASGFFRRADGRPYPNLDVIFTPRFKPAIVEENGVMWGSINTRTDKNGYLEIDLFRHGEYSVLVESLDDCPRLMSVPDLPAMNLVHLLFPVVQQVTFVPPAVALMVGEEVSVIPEVLSSDGRILQGAALQDVYYFSDDTAVAAVSAQNDRLVITGLAPGATQISVERLDETIVVIPDLGIMYAPLTVTVV